MARIGVYSGTFDPVHSGHIAFALQAMQTANLDKVYFLPERRPRAKPHVEHYAHRVAMLTRALRPHPRFQVQEMVEQQFSIAKTLPLLLKLYKNNELVFLFGSDVIPGIASWPNAGQLLKDAEIVVGLRNNDSRESIKTTISNWKTHPKSVTIFDSYAPHITSGRVRSAIRKNQQTSGLLSSVEKYSDNNWLYVSLANVDIP